MTIRSHPRGGRSLSCKTGRRVGYVDLAGNVMNVERDESKCADRAGHCKCAGTELTEANELLKQTSNIAGWRLTAYKPTFPKFPAH